MPTPVEAVAVGVLLAVAYGAFFLVVAAICGTNTKTERRERLRPAGRLAESALTFPDRQLDADREQHYADMGTMARARMRGDRNLVETPPASARRGRAA